MNDKIKLKLEIMQAWVDLSEAAEAKIKSTQDSIEYYKTELATEMLKPEEERSSWRIKDCNEEIEKNERIIAAFQNIQTQILKLMG